MFKQVRIEMYIPPEYIGDVTECMLKSGHYRLSILHGGEKPTCPSPCEGCKYMNCKKEIFCTSCNRVGMGYGDNWEASDE